MISTDSIVSVVHVSRNASIRYLIDVSINLGPVASHIRFHSGISLRAPSTNHPSVPASSPDVECKLGSEATGSGRPAADIRFRHNPFVPWRSNAAALLCRWSVRIGCLVRSSAGQPIGRSASRDPTLLGQRTRQVPALLHQVVTLFAQAELQGFPCQRLPPGRR